MMSSKGESDSEESSRDTSQDEDDPLSLPICARDISGKLYDLATRLDEVGSFPAKISILHPYLIPTLREMGQNYMKTFKPYTHEVKDAVINVLKAQLKLCVNYVSNRQKNVPSTSNDGNLENMSDRVVSLEQSMVEVVAYVRKEKLRRIEKKKKQKGAVDPVAIVDEVTIDEVVGAIDLVVVDVVDEVAVAVDVVAVDDVAGTVDPVAVDVVDEVAVDDVAGVVDLVAVDIVDEVAGDAIDGVAEEKKEEEKTKEKSGDEEEKEDDCAENSVDMMSIVMELNGEINGEEKNN
ncbi:hypothetical protein H5410_002568 [Solanum commersonii]|uniref:Uncharacterized protein n=1 Tax=Solanum commersonii TaxID=4109 RepID=A0A9J6B2M0_SOLCO|nr:hypothetical protein H5410_002568 [Solanum commersonii]